MMKPKSKKKQTEIMHPDHTPEISRVRKIIGQLEGVEKMIVTRRYCLQILQQIKAATSALTALRIKILKRHLSECVNESASTGNYSRLAQQISEIVQTQVRS